MDDPIRLTKRQRERLQAQQQANPGADVEIKLTKKQVAQVGVATGAVRSSEGHAELADAVVAEITRRYGKAKAKKVLAEMVERFRKTGEFKMP